MLVKSWPECRNMDPSLPALASGSECSNRSTEPAPTVKTHWLIDQKAIILIVSDDERIVRSLVETLPAAGYTCYGACDSKTALKTSTHVAADLIVYDLDIDAQRRFETYVEIRARLALDDVPIIFLSELPEPDTTHVARSGASDYELCKSFEDSVLLDLVANALWMPHLVAAHLGALPCHPHAPDRQTSPDGPSTTQDAAHASNRRARCDASSHNVLAERRSLRDFAGSPGSCRFGMSSRARP